MPRLANDEKIKRLEQKKEVLQKELKALKTVENKKKRKLQTRKKIIIGGQMLKWFNSTNDQNKKWFMDMLNKGITKEADRKLLNLDKITTSASTAQGAAQTAQNEPLNK